MALGSEIIFEENLTSTNTHAIHLLSLKKIQEGTVIQTNYQSAGRGQPGNSWESEDGKNLLFSLILYPSMLKPDAQFIVSMAISLGITDYLNHYIQATSIKWPNDIYVNSDKIAGILIESSIMGSNIEYLIAGIGLNVNQEIFKGNAPNPVSMKKITGVDYIVSDCLTSLVANLDNRYNQILSGEYNKIKDDYNSRLFRNMEWFEFRDKEGIFTGRIREVTNSGTLIIEKRSGVLTEYFFKEVEFIL
jgi:BirA family transcriptional regulator, biotin operon repressor / biotin---[acetyl-CoA-carboxylase] ligase